jgi:hypothetical protein
MDRHCRIGVRAITDRRPLGDARAERGLAVLGEDHLGAGRPQNHPGPPGDIEGEIEFRVPGVGFRARRVACLQETTGVHQRVNLRDMARVIWVVPRVDHYHLARERPGGNGRLGGGGRWRDPASRGGRAHASFSPHSCCAAGQLIGDLGPGGNQDAERGPRPQEPPAAYRLLPQELLSQIKAPPRVLGAGPRDLLRRSKRPLAQKIVTVEGGEAIPLVTTTSVLWPAGVPGGKVNLVEDGVPGTTDTDVQSKVRA